MMEKASRHLDEYVEADVKVSTVDKLVGEESPNLFLLLRVENEWALVKENMHIISKLFCHLSKNIQTNRSLIVKINNKCLNLCISRTIGADVFALVGQY